MKVADNQYNKIDKYDMIISINNNASNNDKKVLEEKIADCKLYIYDSDVEILYSSNNSSYSKTHKKYQN